MTKLVAYEIQDGISEDSYWEIFEYPLDPPVTTVEGKDFGDYISEMLQTGYVSDILVNTYESWLINELSHSDYL